MRPTLLFAAVVLRLCSDDAPHRLGSANHRDALFVADTPYATMFVSVPTTNGAVSPAGTLCQGATDRVIFLRSDAGFESCPPSRFQVPLEWASSNDVVAVLCGPHPSGNVEERFVTATRVIWRRSSSTEAVAEENCNPTCANAKPIPIPTICPEVQRGVRVQ